MRACSRLRRSGRPDVPLAVCATPIGNLEDITFRVLTELREASVVLAEDTRHTRILFDRYEITTPLLSCHEHNEAARAAEIVPRLLAGERIALVTDAGLPGVSDPGARVIAAAIDAGAEVTVLPGASAVDTALVASGLVGERYAFIGFLPRKEGELREVWEELSSVEWPVVAFESPKRLPKTLASLAAADPGRRVAVCRELTKKFEEVVRGTAAEVAAQISEPPPGEIVLVIGPGDAEVGAAALAAAHAAEAKLVAAGTPRKAAAEVVSELTGMSRNDLYRDGL